MLDRSALLKSVAIAALIASILLAAALGPYPILDLILLLLAWAAYGLAGYLYGHFAGADAAPMKGGILAAVLAGAVGGVVSAALPLITGTETEPNVFYLVVGIGLSAIYTAGLAGLLGLFGAGLSMRRA